MVACDDDTTTTTTTTPVAIVGTVSGTVSVEGMGLAGVTVSLVGAASQSATTGAGGTYSFANVPSGTYGVQVSGGPADVTFGTTSTVVTITTSGQTVTADFGGNYIRTSSIRGSVTGGGTGIVATVNVAGTGMLAGVSAAGTSDTDGDFEFTGLRAGDYTVTVSDFGTADITVTSRDVTVAVGQSANVTFIGTVEEVTTAATVTISTITASGTAGVTVIPTAVLGPIDVNLVINEGTSTLVSASVLLDGVVVGTQTFSTGAPEEGAEGAERNATIQINTAAYGAAPGALCAVGNGAPTYPAATPGTPNNRVVSATVTTQDGATASASNSRSLTFTNPDVIIGQLSSATSAVSGAAVLWMGGSLTLDLEPVLYSGLTMGSIATALSINNATPPAPFPGPFAGGVAITDLAAPFQNVYSASCVAPIGPICNYQTDVVGFPGDGATITAATYSNGTAFNVVGPDLAFGTADDNVTINGAVGLFAVSSDNVGPTLSDPAVLTNGFRLADQAAAGGGNTATAAGNGWLPSSFPYSTALGLTQDDDDEVPAAAGAALGVGGVTTTFHSGAATLTTVALRALASAATPAAAGLAQGILNSDFQVDVGLWDALSNVNYYNLGSLGGAAPGTQVPLGTNPGITFGLDDTAPTATAIGAGSITDRVILNAGSAAHTLGQTWTGVEDAAGFSATPVQATIFRLGVAPNALPWLVGASATTGGVVNIAGGIAACAAIPTNAVPCVPEFGVGMADAYYTTTGTIMDQAGNMGTTFVRDLLLDVTIPTTSNVAIPPVLTGGALTTFSASVADNLDLNSTAFSLDAAAAPGNGVFIPWGAEDVVTDGMWDGTLTPTASASQSIPFIRSIELAGTGYVDLAPAAPTPGAPGGVLLPSANVRAITSDAAGNLSAPAANNFIAGTVPAGTADVTTGDFIISNGGAALTSLCDGKGLTCVAPLVGSVTLTAQAHGPAGTYANPFATGTMYFYRVVDGGDAGFYTADDTWDLLGSVSGASASITDLGAGALGRTYTWSFAITTAMASTWYTGVPPGVAEQLVVVGVDGAGDALVASPNNNILVVTGS